jgi:hypothetical protein
MLFERVSASETYEKLRRKKGKYRKHLKPNKKGRKANIKFYTFGEKT